MSQPGAGPRPGQTLGPFQIVREVGQGGMGAVYHAVQTSLNRAVALKVLLPWLAGQPGLIERFRHEAQAAARLRHPNIVVVHDVGQAEGFHYIVMDLLEGASLDRRLAPGAALPPAEAIAVLRQIAAALDYAHRAGVVHRDIKPANIVVAPDGHATLTDFGIARVLGDSAGLTQTGTVLGTATYMAPEQCLAQPVGAAADRYALGVLLYHLLCGRPPFTGDITAVMYAHVHTPPPPAHQLNPALSPSVAAVLARALAKEPAQRFGSCREMVEVAAAALGLPVAADSTPLPVVSPGGAAATPNQRAARGPATPVAMPAPGTPLPQPRPGAPAGSRAPIAAAFAAAMLVLVALAAWRLMPAATSSPTGAPPATAGLVTGSSAQLSTGRGGAGAAAGPTLVALAPTPPAPIAAATDVPPTTTPQVQVVTATPAPAPPTAVPPTPMIVVATPPPTPVVIVVTATPPPTPVPPTVVAPAPAPPTTASAPPSGDPTGSLVLVRPNSSAGKDLYRLDLATNRLTRLTTPRNTWNWAPAASPDGDWIAYATGKPGGSNIALVRRDGADSTWRLLAQNDGSMSYGSPWWSPDGAMVAFGGGRGEFGEIYAMPRSGGSVRQITNTDGIASTSIPTWSPGGMLAFAGKTNSIWHIFTWGNSSPVRQISPSGTESYAPAWSPDGRRIAFQNSLPAGVVSTNPEGTDLRAVAPSGAGSWSRAPAWSPDGRWLAFVSNRDGADGQPDDGDVYVVPADGGTARRVTSFGDVYDWRVAWLP